MNDREMGAVLGLVASAIASLETARAMIVEEQTDEMEESLEPLTMPSECQHQRTKLLPAMGGGDQVELCLDCEEIVSRVQ